MTVRFDLGSVEPKAMQVMMELEHYVRSSGLDRTLIELIKVRASQINRCAFCIDMHTKDARHAGEAEQRLYALIAWEETPFFTPQERAVLALTEAVTRIGENGVTEALYAEVNQYFTPQQIAQLVMALVVINAWNRLSISARMLPGSYQVEAA
ncbi:MAG: carboxymuconolactone decarboxylase family protein [Cyanobacteria bacterium J06597_1]